MKAKRLRILAVMLAVCLVTVVGALLSSCASLAFDGIDVDTSKVKTTFNYGDSVTAADFSALNVTVKFNDSGENYQLDLSKATFDIPADVTKSVGDKTITVTFNDEVLNEKHSCSFVIKVEDPLDVLGTNYSGVEVKAADGTALALEYTVGDTVSAADFASLIYGVKYSKAERNYNLNFSDITLNIPEDLTATSGLKSVSGTFTDSFLGGVRTFRFDVNVKPLPAYTGTTIDSSLTTMVYQIGNTVTKDCFANLKVTVCYEKGDRNLDYLLNMSDVTFDIPANVTATLGQKEIVGHFVDSVWNQEHTFTVTIEVVEYIDPPRYASAEVSTTGITKSFTVNDTLTGADFVGLSVKVKFEQSVYDYDLVFANITFVIPEDATATEGDKTVTGRFTDQRTHAEKEFTFTIHVNPLPVFTGISVDTTNVTLNYTVGDSITRSDFNALKTTVSFDQATATYSFDGLPTNVTFTIPTDFTATIGEKTLTATFTDKVLKQTRTFDIKVVVMEKMPDKVQINSFNVPTSYSTYKGRINNSLAFDQSSNAAFESSFFTDKDTKYYVGDDNVFHFLPVVSYNTAFSGKLYTSLTVKVNGTALTMTTEKSKVTNAVKDIAKFYDAEGKLLLTVDTVANDYYFTADAVGKDFSITVKPNADCFTVFDDLLCKFAFDCSVIDAYNVYTAKDLCVIDNTDYQVVSVDEYRPKNAGGDYLDTSWVSFKEQNGYNNVGAIKGVVFHNNIALTADAIPANALIQSKSDITYYWEDHTPETETVAAGTYYLRDWSEVYHRVVADGETFTIQGNYFTLDTQNFPLAPSNNVVSAFNNDAVKIGYESDTSNATLFVFSSAEGATACDTKIQNILIIGNANRNEWSDKSGGGDMKSAGGLILEKCGNACTLTTDNVIVNSFFISFFTIGENSHTNINYTKCYDSYQNAAMSWGIATGETFLNIDHCYMKRAGGPLIILVHNDPSSPATGGGDGYLTGIPHMTATNSVLESFVNGQELWFTQKGASLAVAQIIAGDAGLSQVPGYGSYTRPVNSNGEVVATASGDTVTKINLVCLIMSSGTSLAEITGNPFVQGDCRITSVNGNTTVMTRMHSSGTATAEEKATAYAILQKLATGAQVFNVTANDTSDAVYINTYPYYVADGTAAMPAPAAYASADYIALSQGGMSLLLGHYN